MGKGDCVRCVVSEAQALPETFKIRGSREALYCRLEIDAPITDEKLAGTYVVLVLRSGIASVTDISDVQRRALRSAVWQQHCAAAGHDPQAEAHVLRVISLAYPEAVETLRRKAVAARAQA
jgi:hypothetical protein